VMLSQPATTKLCGILHCERRNLSAFAGSSAIKPYE
jgi:hypothetical protein